MAGIDDFPAISLFMLIQKYNSVRSFCVTNVLDIGDGLLKSVIRG